MNVLLTCAGRRSYLVEYFKDVLGGTAKVFTANSTPDAAAMVVSDGAFVAPPIHDEGYIDFLKKICIDKNIKLLVPLFDMELPILANRKGELERIGVRVAVSKPDVVEMCNDKMKTTEFIRSIGLSSLYTSLEVDEVLKVIEKGALQFPLYIKPRWGMGSIAVSKASNELELRTMFGKIKQDANNTFLKHYVSYDADKPVIIQETAKGQEYGLDVVNDFDGNYVTTFIKKKLDMRSGETDSALTEDIPLLHEVGRKIGVALRHIGNLDVDIFLDGGAAIILEMNARFGGGYPFSHLAGADLPKAYVYWANNGVAPKECFTIQYGVKGLKDIRILNHKEINVLEPHEQ